MNINEWTGEPRTTAELVQDLLNIAQESEWVEVSRYCPRGCCYEGTARACPTCHVEAPEHKPDCKRAETLREAEAFLTAEDALEREKTHALEAVSDHQG